MSPFRATVPNSKSTAHLSEATAQAISTPTQVLLQHASDGALEGEVFRRFPYGLVVVDDQGTVVSRNLAATRLIETIELPGGDLTCCQLLGCRQPDGLLSQACMTELAISRDTPLPEVRVDIMTSAGVRAMWVAAAPLGGSVSCVVFELRPGVAKDRRRRTDPHWMTSAKLRIETLGRTMVESAEGPIGGEWLDKRAGQLLKYLVVKRHRSVTVDEIAESIWPEANYSIGGTVRALIHELRRKIEPHRGKREPSLFLSCHNGSYRLNPSCLEIDADQFEAHITAGLAAADLNPVLGADEIERGLALYRGDFLVDLPYAEWTIAERDRLHDLACVALRRLTELRLESCVIDDAVRCLERLTKMQPYDEEAYRRLMELDMIQGRQSDALRRYALLCRRMEQAFNQAPSFKPADLTSLQQ